MNILSRVSSLLFLALLVATAVLLPSTSDATTSFATQNRGRILLQVEENGEAWYVNPADTLRYYLARDEDAFDIMRNLGVGITNANLERIPGEGSPIADEHADFVESVKGKILLQVEANGEAWYVDPSNGQRFYLGRPDDAFRIMRERGVGITNDNLALIQPDVSLVGYSLYDTEAFPERPAATFVVANHGSLTHALSDFKLVEGPLDQALSAYDADAVYQFPGNVTLSGGDSVLVFATPTPDQATEDLLGGLGYVWDVTPYDWLPSVPSIIPAAHLYGANGTSYRYATPSFIALCGESRSDAEAGMCRSYRN